MLVILSTFILSVIMVAIALPKLIDFAIKKHLYDLPDSRKIHKFPIPRIGGVAFLPIVIIASAIILLLCSRLLTPNDQLWQNARAEHFIAYFGGGVMLFLVGLYDDIWGASYKIKFLVQLIAAIFLCIAGLWVADFHGLLFIHRLPFWVGIPITIAMVVYVTNATNLIDGIDGLLSGLSIIALGVNCILNYITHNILHAVVAASLMGAIVVFFYYNVFSKKKKTFMGDAGSLTIGYTLSFLIIHYWQARTDVVSDSYDFPCIVATSTLIIPCFDVVRVFASRIRDGRNPFLPDKNHIHHKFMRAGLTPHWTMATILLLSSAFVLVNYIASLFLNFTFILLLDIALFIAIHLITNRFIHKKERPMGIEWDRAM